MCSYFCMKIWKTVEKELIFVLFDFCVGQDMAGSAWILSEARHGLGGHRVWEGTQRSGSTYDISEWAYYLWSY
jgi:hypothetical protein